MAHAEPARKTLSHSNSSSSRLRDSVPELSVLIATFNRAELLRGCLDALAAQSQPARDFEVIVVVDGSTDGTREMLEGYRPPYTLHVEYQDNHGQAHGLNRALETARGNFCLFTDDDVVASPELVAEHLRVQRAGAGAVVVGNLGLEPAGRGGLSSYLARWWENHYAELESGVRRPTFMSCYLGNLSAPADAIRRVGGVATDVVANRDIEFGYRLAQLGLRIEFAPRARATQRYTKSFRQTTRDFERRGVAALTLFDRHPAMLPHLPLGAFASLGFRVTAALRLMLALRIPPWLLVLVDRPLGKAPGLERAYRLFQLYCYWRGVRSAVVDKDVWRRLTDGVIILLYHAVGAAGERPSRFIVPARAFSRQMSWLRFRRYTILSLEEYFHYRAANRLPPPRSVVVTLDDGYADNLSVAAPILTARDIQATIFLVTGSVGGSNHWSAGTEVAERPLLTWGDVERLRENRTSFGAHTRSHPRLRSLPLAEAKREIEGSRADVETHLGGPVKHFAYPYGDRDPGLEQLVGKAGFDSACGISPGRNTAATPALALRRCEIDGRLSILEFAATMWLAQPRRIVPRRMRS